MDITNALNDVNFDTDILTEEHVINTVNKNINDKLVTSAGIYNAIQQLKPHNISELNNDKDYVIKADVPVNISQLVNDKQYITKVELEDVVKNLNSAVDLIKDIIPNKVTDAINGNQYTSLDTVKQLINNEISKLKILIDELPTIPSKVSAFENDVGYITRKDLPHNTSQLVNDSGFIRRDVFNQLSGYNVTMDQPLSDLVTQVSALVSIFGGNR